MSVRDADEILLGFATALRASGVAVTADRARSFLAAAAHVGLADQRATYVAGRATLCGSADDVARYDRIFTAYFDADQQLPRRAPRLEVPERGAPAFGAQDAADCAGDGDTPLQALASSAEVLRHRDVAQLSSQERRRLAALFAQLRPRSPLRRVPRTRSWHRGDLDLSATLRQTLRRHGEPGDLAWRRPRLRPRRVVLLIDISGSMSDYADALLRLAHRYTQALPPGTVETLTLGTRLTHVTRAMQVRDADRAIIAAGDAVADWSGGTRLGETMHVFMSTWGRRGMARGAVVVVFSDGWERGSTDLLRDQMASLHRVAHHVVWVNPHRGKAGYEPVQQGMMAVLPYCDNFVAGHSLAAFAELTEVVADA